MAYVVCPICGVTSRLVREGDRTSTIASADSVPGPLAVCAACGAFVVWVGPDRLEWVPTAEIEALSPSVRAAFLAAGGLASRANG